MSMQLVNIDRIHRKLAFSTTTPLAANAVYTSPTIEVVNYSASGTRGLVFSDVAGSYINQYSLDGVTWISASSTAVAAGGGVAIITPSTYFRYYRLVYTNGATNQTTFQLGVYLAPLA